MEDRGKERRSRDGQRSASSVVTTAPWALWTVAVKRGLHCKDGTTGRAQPPVRRVTRIYLRPLCFKAPFSHSPPPPRRENRPEQKSTESSVQEGTWRGPSSSPRLDQENLRSGPPGYRGDLTGPWRMRDTATLERKSLLFRGFQTRCIL